MKNFGQNQPTHGGHLTFLEALSSSCNDCGDAPCCTHVPLHTFKVETLTALDHIRYLLNFRRIEVGVAASGEWSVLYRYPCRYLDRDQGACTVHGTPEQPSICVHYSPHRCWYKKALTTPVSDSFLRVDLERFEFIAAHVTFDEDRNITEVPDWASIVRAMADYVPPAIDDAPIESDAAFDTWLAEVAAGVSRPYVPESLTYEQLADPCRGCAGYCCQYLVFPGYAPSTASNLDFMRFLLGFPGTEICISERDWTLLVKAECRHLENDRCRVYGRPERPVICQYYDALKCDYKLQLGAVRPPGMVRVRFEQWASVAELFRFDSSGAVMSGPSIASLRAHVEARWREHASDAGEGGQAPGAR